MEEEDLIYAEFIEQGMKENFDVKMLDYVWKFVNKFFYLKGRSKGRVKKLVVEYRRKKSTH